MGGGGGSDVVELVSIKCLFQFDFKTSFGAFLHSTEPMIPFHFGTCLDGMQEEYEGVKAENVVHADGIATLECKFYAMNNEELLGRYTFKWNGGTLDQALANKLCAGFRIVWIVIWRKLSKAYRSQLKILQVEAVQAVLDTDH